MDEAAREKSGPAGIDEVLCDHNGEPLVVFLKSIGRRESNEAKLFSIRKALTIRNSLGLGKLVIERNSANAVKWVSGVKKPPWQLVTVVREIKSPLKGRKILFTKVNRSANGIANFFAKQ